MEESLCITEENRFYNDRLSDNMMNMLIKQKEKHD